MALITDLVGTAVRTFNRDGKVTAVEDITPEFRRLEVEVEGKDPDWAPGHKVQFHLSGVTYRTFTPFAAAGRSAAFLVYRAGHGPATAWVDGLGVGNAVSMFGPRGSLKLDLASGPILVGDETSFALTAAWQESGSHPAVAQIYEVTDSEASRTVLDHLDTGAADLVARSDDDAHQADLTEKVIEAVRAHDGAPLVLTGRAQTIRVIRGALKEAGLSPDSKVKAYWDSNRSGLD